MKQQILQHRRIIIASTIGLLSLVWLLGGFQCTHKDTPEETVRKRAFARQWTQQADLGNAYLGRALGSIRRMVGQARNKHRVAVTLEDVLYGLNYEDIIDLGMKFDRAGKAPDAPESAAQIQAVAHSWRSKYGSIEDTKSKNEGGEVK
ncbi:MAG: hypothetical protein Q8M07_20890 [Prosthecobacter sp.]|nr:hypothetical protein [Prosthecobacter sp.]